MCIRLRVYKGCPSAGPGRRRSATRHKASRARPGGGSVQAATCPMKGSGVLLVCLIYNNWTKLYIYNPARPARSARRPALGVRCELPSLANSHLVVRGRALGVVLPPNSSSLVRGNFSCRYDATRHEKVSSFAHPQPDLFFRFSRRSGGPGAISCAPFLVPRGIFFRVLPYLLVSRIT